MISFIPLEEIYQSVRGANNCVIEAGSFREAYKEGEQCIQYKVNVCCDKEIYIFFIYEMSDFGISGEIANEHRKHHMQFAVQTAEFLYKSIKNFTMSQNLSISFSLKYKMAVPVTGITFNENWDMFNA